MDEQKIRGEQLYFAVLTGKDFREESRGWGRYVKKTTKYVRYLSFSSFDGKVRENFSMEEATALPKSQWKQILEGLRFWYDEWSVKYIKASTVGAFSLFFTPQKYEGTLTLSDVRSDLKKLGVSVLFTVQDSHSLKYSNDMVKYYEFQISNEFADIVERYVSDAHNRADIGFNRPARGESACDRLTLKGV